MYPHVNAPNKPKPKQLPSFLLDSFPFGPSLPLGQPLPTKARAKAQVQGWCPKRQPGERLLERERG